MFTWNVWKIAKNCQNSLKQNPSATKKSSSQITQKRQFFNDQHNPQILYENAHKNLQYNFAIMIYEKFNGRT